MPAACRKILVLLDALSPCAAAVREAARLAQRDAARLELYDCGVGPQLPPGWADPDDAAEVYRALLHDRRLEDLERLARPLRSRGIEVTTCAEECAPLEDAIARHLAQAAPDLILIENPGDGGPSPWRALAEGALRRHARCPVLQVDAPRRSADHAALASQSRESLS
jgi:nucleotide-binding universal stress UspA family protein